MIYHSTKVADAVLNIVEEMINCSDNSEKRVFQEPYQNGREHGHSLQYYNPMKLDTLKVAFAENRNSDAIVVYTGTNNDFSMQGNTPSDKAYDNRRMFTYNEHYKAAEFIIEYLFQE